MAAFKSALNDGSRKPKHGDSGKQVLGHLA